MAPTLDDFKEKRRPVHHGLSKDLEKIVARLQLRVAGPHVVIDQDVELLKLGQVDTKVDVVVNKPLAQVLVVFAANGVEFNAAQFKLRDSGDDIVGGKGNVLHTSTTEIVVKLLDLAAVVAGDGLVKRHFEQLVR